MAQANILINNDRRACLTDFGLSTIVHVPPHISTDTPLSTEVPRPSIDSQVSLVPHNSGGTARWMSPELLNPELFGLANSRPTKQSDCYGLGMVVYEVCRLIAVEFSKSRGITRYCVAESPTGNIITRALSCVRYLMACNRANQMPRKRLDSPMACGGRLRAAG